MTKTAQAGLAAVAATVAAPGSGGTAGKPNVLLILVDDLGWGDLSCFGATDLHTPNIDRLAADGIRFTNFYANSCVCSPTRAAIMTGRFQDFVGVPGVIRTHDNSNWGHLLQDCVLLPQVLGGAGYHTSIIGKWHLGLEAPNIPTRRGFNEFRGWLGDMMDDYTKQRRHGNNYMRNGEQVVDTAGTHATELFTQWSIESLRARAKEQRPFFQYLAYNAPHAPIQPPREWLDRVRHRQPGIDEKRAKLVALIEHLDDGIGRVLKELETLGLARNTLVLFTSDNGGQLGVGANNGPYRSGKCHVYEGGVRVAFCARWPGHIPAGRTSDFQAMTMDLFPTIAEVSGAGFEHHIEGRSFLNALTGTKQPAFGRVDVYRWLESTHKEALRQGDWKLVRDVPGAPFELYNIARDPAEKENLAEREPERLAALVALMREHLGAAEIVPWRRPEQ